jgi:hypothetical protein
LALFVVRSCFMLPWVVEITCVTPHPAFLCMRWITP